MPDADRLDSKHVLMLSGIKLLLKHKLHPNRHLKPAMFPFTISGKVRLKSNSELSQQAVANEVASTLMINGSHVTCNQGSDFRFRPGLINNLSKDFLFGVSSGKIYCSKDSQTLYIHYRLSFIYLYLAITALLISCKYAEKLFSPVTLPAAYYLWTWVWLAAGNIIFTVFTFRAFLRKCARESSGRVFFWHKITKQNELPGEGIMLSSQNDSQPP